MSPFNSSYEMRLTACSCWIESGYDVLIFSMTLLYFLTMMGISCFLPLLCLSLEPVLNSLIIDWYLYFSSLLLAISDLS